MADRGTDGENLRLLQEQLAGKEKALILAPPEDKVRIGQQISELRQEIADFKARVLGEGEGRSQEPGTAGAVQSVLGGQGVQVNQPKAPVILGDQNTVNIHYHGIEAPQNLQAGAPFRVSGGGGGLFVGRGEELARLRRLLGQPGLVAIAAAAGLGGVGKTALARQYVGRYRADYPAGIWWLAPGDRVGNLVIEAEILGWGAPPDNLQTDQQRAQWVYQQWLERFPEGSRLVVWDDGQKFKDIRPFLPSDPRFQVLLTTRSKWGDPVWRLDLDTLPRSDAFRLLRTLMGDDDRLRQELPAAKALCAWLGYLPLALELMGRYLAVRPGVTLAKTLERLEQQRLAARALSNVPEEMEYQYTVQAAFELSWQTLTEPERELLGALSLFALAPIPMDLIRGALADWDEEDLEDGLAGLVGRSLVSVQTGSRETPQEGGHGAQEGGHGAHAPADGRGEGGHDPP